MRALVVDLGSTSVRTAIVGEDGHVHDVRRQPLTVRSPQPGEVELDGHEIARSVRELVDATVSSGGTPDVLAITNQRASTIAFETDTLEPVGPVLGWQDLRTVIDCLVLQGSGLRLAPNQTATKARWLLERTELPRSRLTVGTLDTFVAAVLSRGDMRVTDHSNAAITGLVDVSGRAWDPVTLDLLGLDRSLLATIVPTSGPVGPASGVSGTPMIAALVGDQSASLFGQSCVEAGDTKITFGTGAMLDSVLGVTSPANFQRFPSGCFPIIARSSGADIVWAVEAITLSAGSCVEWLRDSLGLISSPEETESLAHSIRSSEGVSFVPALAGLGTPRWDFGARGAFFGLTRGAGRAHLVRAVLEGIAQRGVDMLDASESDLTTVHPSVRVDGGMVSNVFFTQTLADLSGRTVEISSEVEATTKGAGLMALVGVGALDISDVKGLWRASAHVEPSISDDERTSRRAEWSTIVERAAATIPELSTVTF